MDEHKPKLFVRVLDKIKRIKHIDIYIAVLIGLILVIAYILSIQPKSTKNTETATNNLDSYVRELEDRLGKSLSHIEGAGEVTVMITLEDSIEYTYVMNESEKTVTNNGSSTTTRESEPVIITRNGVSAPVILEEKMPEIKGIIIISSGGRDTSVKLSLIKAAETLFGISGSKVEVFAGN